MHLEIRISGQEAAREGIEQASRPPGLTYLVQRCDMNERRKGQEEAKKVCMLDDSINMVISQIRERRGSLISFSIPYRALSSAERGNAEG